jgi:hypothetical protein
MQAADRSAGIKVIWPSAVSEGTTVTVCGILGSVGTGTSGVERVLNAEEVIIGTASEILPVYLPIGKIGGHLSSVTPAGFSDSFGLASLYNLGLLVRTAGTLTYRDSAETFFYLDDGFGLLDGNTLGGGSPVSGIKVILPSAGVIPPIGKKVAVTGVSSRDTINGKAARVIRMRSHSDLVQTTGATIAGRISRYGSETVDQLIQSAHPYTGNYNNTWIITPSPSASQIRHISRRSSWNSAVIGWRSSTTQTLSSSRIIRILPFSMSGVTGYRDPL